MAIVAGQAVRGKNFWDRPLLMEDMFDIIENGGHILLVAPRRVGKTSLMYRILDTNDDGYIVLYVDTEAEHDSNAFWMKLFSALMDKEFLGSVKNQAKNFYTKIVSICVVEVGPKGIKFGEDQPIDYALAFECLLRSYDGDKKFIIMIDEFSQTIENIIQHESTESAVQLLQTHRALRQNHKISEKFMFIYAGSIGLEGVVANINSSKHINDLVSVGVPPFDLEEAQKFTKHLFTTNKIEVDEASVLYFLQKIEWYIPFYIQLIAQEVKRLYRREPTINEDVIDSAIEKVLANRKEFIHWEERLNLFSTQEKQYAKEVLNRISEDNTIEVNELINIAVKCELSDGAKSVLRALEYDGYINNSNDIRIYRFNSPLLKTWWNKNVAN